MKTTEQQIIETEKKLNELKKKLELEQNDKPIIIKAYGKEFQIHKWENKPFKDFPMPEGFDWAEASDVDKLVNENKFKLEKYPIMYYFKQRYKQNKDYGLSGLYLGWYLDLRSNVEYLTNSSSDGRVIISRSLK